MREEKRWLRHGEMATAIFFFWLRNFKEPRSKGLAKRPISPPKMTANNPQNIRESTLDFTAFFGEINPDMSYLCRQGLSGPEKAVFASFPSIRRVPMKKIVKSSIFCEKTSKFLRFLSFKP